MTFDEIVSEVCERLNLSSDESKSRIGREVNSRYRRITSSIGLQTSRAATISQQATIGDRNMTFSNIEKLFAVIDKTDPKQDTVLEQISPDEMHITPLRNEPPRHYAITNENENSVTIEMDCIPTTQFTLYADVLSTLTTLAGNQAPDFPESFHDILVFGAMSDEYRKMEKLAFYKECEKDYESRLSDLRMFIAKSAYADIYQGRYNSKNFRWQRNAQLLWDQ